MSDLPVPPDQAAREAALDPRRSFLVQAPAGAGKTELLIRRFLRLLAIAAEPEEILAITFTRKAAAEMQVRLIEALQSAARGESSATRILAMAALDRDRQQNWGLLQQPLRLRVMTIDALNATLARAAPASSGTGALRQVTEQPAALYRDAAIETTRMLADSGQTAEAIATLLAHFDYRLDSLETQLARMLARRDQWLPLLGAGPDADAIRPDLEAALGRLARHRIERFVEALPAALSDEFFAVTTHAAATLGRPPRPAAGQGALVAEVGWWRGAASTLQTAEGEWRQRLDRRQGFPPDDKPAREAAMDLLARLRQLTGLDLLLADVGRLPEPQYAEGQWQALRALFRILPVAAAQLRVICDQRGASDFIEVAAAALAALGHTETPSDLALRMDWRIRHVLLDEFQDTSQSQYSLLRTLTRGWTPGDGRSVLLVGDPMQSIYGFRQADVRLFLETRDHGLPGVSLTYLQLTANFRSVPAIVDWLNGAFPQVMPASDDIVAGAVAYAPSEAVRKATAGSGVFLHDVPPGDAVFEAGRVLQLIRNALASDEHGTVAVLVRSRAHAGEILAGLRAAGMPAAVELLHLGELGIAADLLAITRALIHAGDRLAWLAILRAPWCGLTLADLEAVAGGDREAAIPVLCAADRLPATVSADGRGRVTRLMNAFARAEARLGRAPLRDIVAALWAELGGPAVAGADAAYADLVLERIGKFERGGDLPDVLDVVDDLGTTAVSVADPGSRIHVMTIHKAKGLQFDCVIVPGLGSATRSDRRPALLWHDLPMPDGNPELLIAPLNASGADDDRLYEMLWELQRDMRLAEADRLLYVATTRAKRELHLLGQLAAPRDGEAAVPARGTLLDRLWPAIAASWPMTSGDACGDTAHSGSQHRWIRPRLRRLPDGWQPPALPPAWTIGQAVEASSEAAVLFDWASRWAMHAGSVVHRWLQHIAADGVQNYPPARIRELRPRLRSMLADAGVADGDCDRATSRVVDALSAAVSDARGAWLLSADRREASNELALTVAGEGRCRRIVIDRSFVCDDGWRWVIDYKTSSHEGTDIEAFIASEVERYRDQLQTYREAIAAIDPRPVRAALYFPLLGRFVEVPDSVS